MSSFSFLSKQNLLSALLLGSSFWLSSCSKTQPESIGYCDTPTFRMVSPLDKSNSQGTVTDNGKVTFPVSVNVCLPKDQTVTSVDIWSSTTNDGFARKIGTATNNNGTSNTYTMSATLGTGEGQWLSSVGPLDPNTYKFWAVINRGGSLSALTVPAVVSNVASVSSTCTATDASITQPATGGNAAGTLVTGSTNTYTIPFQATVCYPNETIGSVEVWFSLNDASYSYERRIGNAVPTGGSSSTYRMETGTIQGGFGRWDASVGGLYADQTYKFWVVAKDVAGKVIKTTRATPTLVTITK